MAITMETIPKKILIEERFCLGCNDRKLFIKWGFGFWLLGISYWVLVIGFINIPELKHRSIDFYFLLFTSCAYRLSPFA